MIKFLSLVTTYIVYIIEIMWWKMAPESYVWLADIRNRWYLSGKPQVLNFYITESSLPLF